MKAKSGKIGVVQSGERFAVVRTGSGQHEFWSRSCSRWIAVVEPGDLRRISRFKREATAWRVAKQFA